MGFCWELFTCCIGIIIALVILGFIFFRWAFVRKNGTTIIRGPGGFRAEFEDDAKKESLKGWTCSCGGTVETGQTQCPSCGKRRDEGTIDVEYDDQPEGDSPNEGLIDLSKK